MRTRPASVWTGIILFSFDVLLTLWGVVSLLLFFFRTGVPFEYNMKVVALQMVLLLVGAGTLWFLMVGRGWARGGIVLLLGHEVYSLARFLLNFRIEALPVFAVWWTFGVLVKCGALALLFRQDSREWFVHSLAERIERRTGIPPEEQAGLPKRYWGAFALGVLAVGWCAYPLNMIALMMGGHMLEQLQLSMPIQLTLIVSLYSGLLFGVGTAVGWVFDTVRGANAKRDFLRQRVD